MDQAEQYIKDETNGFKPVREGDYTNSNVVLAGTTVVLENTTAIRVYFKTKDGSALDEVMVDNTVLLLNGGYTYVDGFTIRYFSTGSEKTPYCIEISGIYAKDIGHIFDYDFGDWSFTYSVMGYAYSILNSTSSSEAAKTTVKALALYGYEANAYFTATCTYSYDEEGDV